MNNLIENGLTGRVWKFGCNWKRNPRSFYDFIKGENIVIGRNRCPYSVGDLVLITHGFTVNAIAKVTSERFSITTKPEYKSLEKEYSIDYESSTFFANADWYELKGKSFQYQMQRGAVRVRKPEIIKHTFELWNNQNSK